MQVPQEILLYVIWLGLAVVAGVALLVTARRRSSPLGPLFPLQRERAVAWDGFDILFITVLIFFLLPSVVMEGLEKLGFYRWYFGASFRDAKAPLERMIPWARTIVFPLQILLLFSLLRPRGRLEPYQIGLTRHRLFENITLGYLAWVLVTPVVFAVLTGADAVNSLWSPSEKHPFVQLSQGKIPALEWGLLFFVAAVAAPVLEEILFRGLIQRWGQTRTGGRTPSSWRRLSWRSTCEPVTWRP